MNGDEFSLTQSECGSRRSESPSALILAQNVSRASSKSAVSVFLYIFFFSFHLYIFLIDYTVRSCFFLHFIFNFEFSFFYPKNAYNSVVYILNFFLYYFLHIYFSFLLLLFLICIAIAI